MDYLIIFEIEIFLIHLLPSLVKIDKLSTKFDPADALGIDEREPYYKNRSRIHQLQSKLHSITSENTHYIAKIIFQSIVV